VKQGSRKGGFGGQGTQTEVQEEGGIIQGRGVTSAVNTKVGRWEGSGGGSNGREGKSSNKQGAQGEGVWWGVQVSFGDESCMQEGWGCDHRKQKPTT
jgi:hypothetical protein